MAPFPAYHTRQAFFAKSQPRLVGPAVAGVYPGMSEFHNRMISSSHHRQPAEQREPIPAGNNTDLTGGANKVPLTDPLAEPLGLAPMVLINGRYYAHDGYLHCWPGRVVCQHDSGVYLATRTPEPITHCKELVP